MNDSNGGLLKKNRINI